MQAAPAVTVSVGRSGATFVALASLCGLASACCAVWAVQRGDLFGSLTLVAVACAVIGLLQAQWRAPARPLRWDGQGWWLGTADRASPGQLTVALDLDAWLLLRFRTEPTADRPRTHWLALRRADHRRDWHALRCAVHSPRPVGPAPVT